MNQVNFSSLTKTVELSGDKGPLGIHVVPYCSSLSGRMLGLHIKGVEADSRSRRENIFHEDESIVQINGTPLIDKSFAQSQEVFRQALGSALIRLEVLPAHNKPRYEKSLIGQLFSGDALGPHNPSPDTRSPALAVRSRTDPKDAALEARPPDVRAKSADPAPALNPPPLELQPASPSPPAAAAAPPSPPPADPRPRSQSPPPPVARKSPPMGAGLLLPPPVAAKKAGKRIKIDLEKGTEGLGFTVVTRDTAVHGPAGPILVKNILPRGAAVKDGRLLPGDRILEVNGVDMTGRTQEELVAMLRSTKQGESVCVVVSRQDDIFLPRQLKEEDGVNAVVQEDGREQLVLEIPLNDTGSAGLGLSLKGNKSRETGEDLGIFIKSIIHGGAAHKDGRLRVNDQLTAVNGEPLLGRSNHVAMETLRRSMSHEGNARGTIQLLLLRSATQTSQAAASATPEPSESSSHQPTLQPPAPPGGDPQVRTDITGREPPPPRRSSSLLPTLRRRASEPLPSHARKPRDGARPQGDARPAHARHACYGADLRTPSADSSLPRDSNRRPGDSNRRPGDSNRAGERLRSGLVQGNTGNNARAVVHHGVEEGYRRVLEGYRHGNNMSHSRTLGDMRLSGGGDPRRHARSRTLDNVRVVVRTSAGPTRGRAESELRRQHQGDGGADVR